MKDKDNMILIKILKYIQELKQFIKGYNYESFKQDKKTVNACVFNLSQIGELAGKASSEVINENPRNRMAWIKIFKE